MTHAIVAVVLSGNCVVDIYRWACIQRELESYGVVNSLVNYQKVAIVSTT